MIKNEHDYTEKLYRQFKKQELYIEEFEPHRIKFSNGHVLTCKAPDEFDRDIIESILEYNYD